MSRFDDPNRLFYDFPNHWKSCCNESHATNLMELIPEFFYFPYFLRNKSKFEYGTRDDLNEIDNVVLPLWASHSPDKFVFKMREAFESVYV